MKQSKLYRLFNVASSLDQHQDTKILSKNIDVYSRNNSLNTMKDGAYAANTNECKSVGTQRIDFYANGDNVAYFDSFGYEQIPEKIKRLISNNNIIKNI